MTIEDEHGHRWDVGAGDPANPYVLALKARGFTYVVLPATLLTGTPTGDTMELERVVSQQPRHLPPANVEPNRIVRRARLIDCMLVLGGTLG